MHAENPVVLAAIIAIGIGAHNFGEGLAIGASAASGATAIALALIVGFGLHNATEGFGVAAPLVGRVVPTWAQIGLAGLIAGGPTFIGTIVGYTFLLADALRALSRDCGRRAGLRHRRAVEYAAQDGPDRVGDDHDVRGVSDCAGDRTLSRYERRLGMVFGIVLAVTLAGPLDGIAARPQFAHAIVAAEVYDLDAKRPLYARNAGTLMEAASTTKLLTNGTSLALLGPNFRWTTPVYRTGPIDAAGTLHGDLVLVASGDPNLSQRIQSDGSLAFENEDHSYDGSYETRAVPGDPLAVLRDLAAQVVRAGIKQIDGGVVVDASLFADQGPEGGTGAILSPIVVNDNLVDVTVTPGTNAGDPTTISVSPETPYVSFVNQSKTSAAGTEPTVNLGGRDKSNADGSHTVTITGTMPAGRSILFAYRVPEPQRFAQEAFTVALRDAGVTVNAPSSTAAFDHATASAAYTAADLVARHVSPPLSEDVYLTLKVSDNLQCRLDAVYVGLCDRREDGSLEGGLRARASAARCGGARSTRRVATRRPWQLRLLYAALHGELSRMGCPSTVVPVAVACVADPRRRRHALQYSKRLGSRR